MRAYQDYPTREDEQTDEMETIHVYMLRQPLEPEPQPKQAIMWENITHWIVGCIAVFMFSGFCLVPGSPTYAVKTISVPAHFLPVQQVQASIAIVPTGVQTIPATQARGVLTVYNGSILSESLPAGFIVTTAAGVEIVTDQAVTIPAANAPAFGIATIPAHAVVAGAAGNIGAYAISQHDGADISIKNLAAFTGGQNATARMYVTEQDKATALSAARAQIQREQASEKQPKGALQDGPCVESVDQQASSVIVTEQCQFVTYNTPSSGQVVGAIVSGQSVVLRVREIVMPQ